MYSWQIHNATKSHTGEETVFHELVGPAAQNHACGCAENCRDHIVCCGARKLMDSRWDASHSEIVLKRSGKAINNYIVCDSSTSAATKTDFL